MPDIDREIDRLYQMPLDEFTQARNALARTAGADGAAIKQLQKPPVAAWAVNQLYWHKRDDFDALVEAARTLAAAHKAVLSGKRADLRAASSEHEDALTRALKSTLALLQDGGHPATESTRQQILTTLRALPADETPGRLTRVLQPGGFEMLAGLPVKGPAPREASPSRAKSAAARPAEKEDKAAPDAKELAAAKDAAATAARELRLAEHAAKREEFEAARSAREADKAARAVDAARAELDAAQRAVDEAAEEADAAEKKREAAEKRAREADTQVASARTRLANAEKKVAGLTRSGR